MPRKSASCWSVNPRRLIRYARSARSGRYPLGRPTRRAELYGLRLRDFFGPDLGSATCARRRRDDEAGLMPIINAPALDRSRMVADLLRASSEVAGAFMM